MYIIPQKRAVLGVPAARLCKKRHFAERGLPRPQQCPNGDGLAAEQRTGVAHGATVGKIPAKPPAPDGAKEKSRGLSYAPSGAEQLRNQPTHGCTVGYYPAAPPVRAKTGLPPGRAELQLNQP
jgi:hypothetical protein